MAVKLAAMRRVSVAVIGAIRPLPHTIQYVGVGDPLDRAYNEETGALATALGENGYNIANLNVFRDKQVLFPTPPEDLGPGIRDTRPYATLVLRSAFEDLPGILEAEKQKLNVPPSKTRHLILLFKPETAESRHIHQLFTRHGVRNVGLVCARSIPQAITMLRMHSIDPLARRPS